MKAAKVPVAEQPTTVDTLVAIADLVVGYWYEGTTPAIADIAKATSFAARCLHIRDRAERIACENQAVLTLAKKHAALPA
jgi:hypothetical protein